MLRSICIDQTRGASEVQAAAAEEDKDEDEETERELCTRRQRMKWQSLFVGSLNALFYVTGTREANTKEEESRGLLIFRHLLYLSMANFCLFKTNRLLLLINLF